MTSSSCSFGSRARFPFDQFLRVRSAALLVLASAAGPLLGARAQCDPHWVPGFEQVVLGNEIFAATTHQNSLIFGGFRFESWSTPVYRLQNGVLAGIGNVANNPFASEAQINALLSFDFGSGPEVVVGGLFDDVNNVSAMNIARWDGSAWHPMSWGLGDSWDIPVRAVCAFDDGSGTKLYAGGDFDLSGGAHGIARWNGSTWEAVGGAAMNRVGALCVHDDGTGPALYAAGNFTQVGTPGGPVAASSIARWNGSSWSAVGAINANGASVNSLAVHDDGNGNKLYVGGIFNTFGGVSAAYIASWNGSSWSPLGAGLNNYAARVISFDDGTGRALYAFGGFTQAGGAPAARAARWNGSTWAPLGTGLDLDGKAAIAWDDGTGSGLIVGGSFANAGSVHSPFLARWRANGWGRVTTGNGFDTSVNALIVHDDGTGSKLFAAGFFTQAGDQGPGLVARFDGSTWNTLGGGLSGGSLPYYSTFARAMVAFDDGTGTQLYVGGSFVSAGGHPARNLARWNGTTWSAVPGGDFNGVIYSLCVHDDGSGPALYAGGNFTQIGGLARAGIARWNGSTWSPLSNGILPSGNGYVVYAMTSFDDGAGQALFVGGSFAAAGSVAGTQHVALWRNGAWSPLGGPFFGGANRQVNYLGVHDGGQGPRLWLGGQFTQLGGFYAKGVGTWDGTRFWPVGTGFPFGAGEAYAVNTLCTYDDGTHGPQVWAGGTMQSAVDPTLLGLARWDGATWHAVPGGLTGPLGANPHAAALVVQGSSLWAGGGFVVAGGISSSRIGRLDPTCVPAVAYCFGDGSGTACPCGNAGASGNGCATSFNANGANLTASGTASVSADTITLTSSGTSAAIVTFLQGSQRQNGGAGSVFGDGLRCAGGTVVRLGGVNAPGGTAQYPPSGGQSVSVRGQVPAAGGTRTYQVWYRNAGAFCTPSTFNLTNGVEIQWAP